jgi:DNA-binding CsgD family transcriptional regulator
MLHCDTSNEPNWPAILIAKLHSAAESRQMHSFHTQKHPEPSHTRSIHQLLKSNEAPDNESKQPSVETPTVAMCANCQASRERDELFKKMFGFREAADKHLATLTNRQYVIMQMVLAGHPSKNIAADLHISQRTVENHRASIMKRTGARSLPELTRLALALDWSNATSSI